ncbi:hypothetical protein HDV00_001045 [Rhizophlyctis rosea]|nr:hypothetical protein HDV00_001045 [Rhizophlyctis rosea]
MDITEEFIQHIADIVQLRQETAKVIAQQRQDLQLSHHDVLTIAEIMGDDALLFRFSKKNAHTLSKSQPHLLTHLSWRLETRIPPTPCSLSSLSQTSLHYLRQGIFRFTGFDKEGRPLAVLNLKPYLEKDAGGGEDLEDLMAVVYFMMDVGRRMMLSRNEEAWRRWYGGGGGAGGEGNGLGSPVNGGAENGVDDGGGGGRESRPTPKPPTLSALPTPTTPTHLPPHLTFQIALLIDASTLTLTSLPLSSLPTLHKSFSTHFPQIFGAVYVINYGWAFAGAWGAVRTLFSKESIGRVRFLGGVEEFRGVVGEGCVMKLVVLE